MIDPGQPLFLLHPGHGVNTPGKRSPGKESVGDGRPGVMEWEFNRDIIRRVKHIAPVRGLQVFNMNPFPQSRRLKDVVAHANRLAKSYPKAVFIDIHANAAGLWGWNKTRGARVFTAKKCSTKSTVLARMWADWITTMVPEWDGRTFIKRKSFYTLKNTLMPAVYLEHGFMTNREDVEILSNNPGRGYIAQALVQTLTQFKDLEI